MRPPPAPELAFCEGVNVLFPGTEEIQEINPSVLTGFTNAQENKILAKGLRGDCSLVHLA